jgi:hypothetical protein
MQMRYLCVSIGTVCALAGLIAGCQKSSDGTPVRSDQSTAGTTSTSTAVSTTSATEVPGVKETLPDTIPPNALICFSSPTDIGTATPAAVADPAAPRVTISVPSGWMSNPGTGDVALTLAGPDGMSGTVTIAVTTLEPAAAFEKYSDDLAGKAPISSINVRPAEFCGYSSQELFGTLSDPPAEPVEFADRITHIWTNTKKYLVAIHLQGPKAAAGFDDAKTALMQNFAVVIP